MYEVTVDRVFCAAHAISVRGEREPTHGHEWRVRVGVGGQELDEDGILCDFHALERRLDDVIAPFQDCDLNRTPPFDRVSPTAERIARHLAEAIVLPEGLTLLSVGVTEAPGCVAVYRPERG